MLKVVYSLEAICIAISAGMCSFNKEVGVVMLAITIISTLVTYFSCMKKVEFGTHAEIVKTNFFDKSILACLMTPIIGIFVIAAMGVNQFFYVPVVLFGLLFVFVNWNDTKLIERKFNENKKAMERKQKRKDVKPVMDVHEAQKQIQEEKTAKGTSEQKYTPEEIMALLNHDDDYDPYAIDGSAIANYVMAGAAVAQHETENIKG